MSADNELDEHCFAQHVDEGDELRQIVAHLVDSRGTGAAAGYGRFSQIVTKYQEQSQLLDPLLEDMVKPLAALLHKFALDFDSTDPAIITDISRFLWLLSTARGYKVVLRFFPNEVSNFEPVVAMLGKLNQVEAARGVCSEAPSVWEAQYVLLLWLSMLVLIPFHLSLVDSSLGGATPAGTGTPPPAAPPTPLSAAAVAGSQSAARIDHHAQAPTQTADGGSGGYPPIVGTILELCRGYLGSPGSVREVAAVVVGRLVTRPDMRGALEEWVGWGCEALQRDDGLPRSGFLVLGVALTFATIFKLGKRDALLGPAVRVFPAAATLLGSPTAATNALARKLAVKLIQRIGLVFLRPRVAAWRYSKGRSTLLGRARAEAAAAQGLLGGGGEVGPGPADVEAEAEEDVEHAEQIEGVIEALLTGLGDRDTVVRWSAAKGLGRVTGRLPKDLGDDVVASVLDSFFTPGASDTAWHGGCLAVAELARRGLLLPERLPVLAPLVAAALEYDVRRGSFSVGAHVRDAAAFVCWACARAYTPEALGEAAGQLAPALIAMACYDREVNCRRAAAAAYQECVGRLGSFPHGIQILTAADYFTVSTRSAAFLRVGPYVAGFPEYFEPLARHLLGVKLRHWEKRLRELAAGALAELVPHRAAFFLAIALPMLLQLVTDNVLEVRHGAVAGIAELLPALRLVETTGQVCLPLTPDQQACLYGHIRDNLRHASPELQRAAAAALRAYANSYLPAATPDALALSTACFVGELREGAGAAGAPVRRGVALALGALPRRLLDPLQQEVLTALAAATDVEASPDSRDAEARANAVGALGQVTLTLYCPPSPAVDVVGLASAPPPLHGSAEAAGSSSGGAEGAGGEGLAAGAAAEVCRAAVEPMLRAMEDYSTDNRGDVGSWVREAAMEQLTRLLLLLLPRPEASAQLPLPLAPPLADVAPRVLRALLRQSLERISRVREAAARALHALLPPAAAAGVAGAAEMAAAVGPLPLEAFGTGEALPGVAALLVQPPMQLVVLEGLAFSIGGLDHQLAAAAGDALAVAVQRVAAGEEEGNEGAAGGAEDGAEGEEARLSKLGEAFVGLWEEVQAGVGAAAGSRRARLATPLLATADVLLSRTPLRDLLATATSAIAAAAAVTDGGGAEGEAAGGAAAVAGGATADVMSVGAWGLAGRLLGCVRGEVRGCTDIPRLHLAACVLCQLADLPQPVKAAALASAIALLANRYPKVRRYAAEQLYTALLTFDPEEWGSSEAPPDADTALELLSEIAWDGPLEEVKPARSRVYQCFGLPEPRPLAPKAGGAAAAAAGQQGRADENASYQALIDRAMRGM